MFKVGKTAIIIAIVVVILVVTGVWVWRSDSNPKTEPATEEKTEEAASETVADNPAVESLKLFLVENGVNKGEIKILNASRKDWPDGCLGIDRGGGFCTQVITPGYEITVRIKNQELKYRTNLDGSTIWRDTSGGDIGFLKG